MKIGIKALKKKLQKHVFMMTGDNIHFDLEPIKKRSFSYQTKVCENIHKHFVGKYGQYNEMLIRDCFEELSIELETINYLNEIRFENNYLRFDVNESFVFDQLDKEVSGVLSYKEKEEKLLIDISYDTMDGESLLKKLIKTRLEGESKETRNLFMDKGLVTKSNLDNFQILMSNYKKVSKNGERDIFIQNDQARIPIVIDNKLSNFSLLLNQLDSTVLTGNSKSKLTFLFNKNFEREVFYFNTLFQKQYDSIEKMPVTIITTDNDTKDYLDYFKRLIIEIEANCSSIYIDEDTIAKNLSIDDTIATFLKQINTSQHTLEKLKIDTFQDHLPFFHSFIRQKDYFDLYFMEGKFIHLRMMIHHLFDTITYSIRSDDIWLMSFIRKYITEVFRLK